uniref:GST N-terminal domain-containing protein n=1 Tax=Oxyrrhis marina TaxID=2969 RepID=A0A7S3UQ50_OXYMA
MSQLEMGYWGIRGLGSVLRMVFEYKEAQYTDVQFTDGAKWFKEKKPEILAKNPLANLPHMARQGPQTSPLRTPPSTTRTSRTEGSPPSPSPQPRTPPQSGSPS